MKTILALSLAATCLVATLGSISAADRSGTEHAAPAIAVSDVLPAPVATRPSFPAAASEAAPARHVRVILSSPYEARN